MPTPCPPSPAAIPDGPELLTLEQRSRRQGSGIGTGDLAGVWRLDALWSKRGAAPLTGAAALLRSLQASLAIEVDSQGELHLRNSVQLGPLQLRFLGPGQLRGRRPLLVFCFERWQLGWGRQVWAAGALAKPAPQRQPFFALIACGQTSNGEAAQHWLAARGRGGGLALWRRSGSPD